MSYFERKTKMKLYESKLNEKSTNEEILKTKKGVSPYKVGDIVKYNDEEYVVKFCDKGNCIIEKDDEQQFIECSKLELIKNPTLDEHSEWEVVYKVEAYNKDADVYTEYLSTIDYEEALEKAKSLNKLCVADKLFDTDGEPFDWIQITVDEKPIWVGDKKVVETQTQITEDLSDSDNKKDDVIDTVATIETNIPSAGEIGIENAVRTNAIDLLKETLSLVDKINTSIINFADVGADKSVVDVLTTVLAEQNICVGKLYELVKIVNPQSALTELGERTVKSEN